MLTLLAGGAALLTTLGAQAEAPPRKGTIEFVSTVQGTRGIVRCGLFSKSGWLERPVQAAAARVAARHATCVFRDVAPGVYGISAFHDENENGKLDKNFIGLPTEDYCASRNARNPFGPPSFADAKFQYAGGVQRLTARMK